MTHHRTSDIKLHAKSLNVHISFNAIGSLPIPGPALICPTTDVSMHGRRYSSSALTLQLAYEILLPSFAFLQIIYPLVHDLNEFSTHFKIEGLAYVSVLIQGRNPRIIKPLGKEGGSQGCQVIARQTYRREAIVHTHIRTQGLFKVTISPVL